ncbi:hypothetical protein LTR62_001472 [Meristemomyces frigidus]|uniref:Cutinase n=1 Tax=Meristemomyces frigidus TaxID=1508187 RepID=A0AAN7TLJ2_9PEZI|nr:hypothetical protein LTR62_001472 [Meristemomyces frigidus]
MHITSTLLTLGVALTTSAAPVEERAATCSAYTIINTRGTGELQGESAGFRTMNSNVQSQVPGGTIYNTVYAADFSQDSQLGTADVSAPPRQIPSLDANVKYQIVNKVHSLVQSNPAACVILEGYSQGAAATVNAMSQLTGSAFDAVKGVFLIGDPEHRAGLACNVDQNGGTTTKNVNGLSVLLGGGIPANWVAKTLDVCNFGDGVCDTTHGFGIDAQHLAYPTTTSVQNLGTKYVIGALTGTK